MLGIVAEQFLAGTVTDDNLVVIGIPLDRALGGRGRGRPLLECQNRRGQESPAGQLGDAVDDIGAVAIEEPLLPLRHDDAGARGGLHGEGEGPGGVVEDPVIVVPGRDFNVDTAGQHPVVVVDGVGRFGVGQGDIGGARDILVQPAGNPRVDGVENRVEDRPPGVVVIAGSLFFEQKVGRKGAGHKRPPSLPRPLVDGFQSITHLEKAIFH